MVLGKRIAKKENKIKKLKTAKGELKALRREHRSLTQELAILHEDRAKRHFGTLSTRIFNEIRVDRVLAEFPEMGQDAAKLYPALDSGSLDHWEKAAEAEEDRKDRGNPGRGPRLSGPDIMSQPAGCRKVLKTIFWSRRGLSTLYSGYRKQRNRRSHLSSAWVIRRILEEEPSNLTQAQKELAEAYFVPLFGVSKDSDKEVLQASLLTDGSEGWKLAEKVYNQHKGRKLREQRARKGSGAAASGSSKRKTPEGGISGGIAKRGKRQRT